MSSKVYKKRTVFVSNPNLRSKTAIRSSDTRYFTDSSIGVILQGKKGVWRAMRLTLAWQKDATQSKKQPK